MVRSRQKEIRRQSILDAAEELIRETRSTDFPMLLLAERAGTSPATPYNAFGGKASILYALLVKSLDTIFFDFDKVTLRMKPHEVALAAAKGAADFFIADPDYYRPLYHYLIGVSDQVYRPSYLNRALNYWRSALAPLRRAENLRDDIERDALARLMMILFLGALDLWVQGEITHEEFRAHIVYGAASLLCSVVNAADREELGAILEKAKEDMPRNYSFVKNES